jgi:hypothetical protein
MQQPNLTRFKIALLLTGLSNPKLKRVGEKFIKSLAQDLGLNPIKVYKMDSRTAAKRLLKLSEGHYNAKKGDE